MPSILKAEDLEPVEELIRSGRSLDAQSRIQTLRSYTIPRELRCGLANLSWRAGLPEIAVSILGPYVKAEEPLEQPTPREAAEYAQSLLKIGATAEAIELLESLDLDATPEGLLYRAFAYVSIWDYKSAAPILERFVRQVEPDSYRSLVGRVNLAGALSFERRGEEAFSVLKEAIELANRLKATLLLGNCLEISAQLYLAAREFGDAARCLSQALARFEQVGSPDPIYARKWRAVMDLKKELTPETLDQLAQVRVEALSIGHWETVRDCDFHRAMATGDQELFAHLYFGTPHAAYRARMKHDFHGNSKIPEQYIWRVSGEPSDRCLDVARGEELGTAHVLSPGSLAHRLLQSLTSDLYRPHRPVALYSALFRGEYFNPQSSLARVHQAIKLLRTWFVENGVPLSVETRGGFYRLEASKPYALRLSIDPIEQSAAGEQVLFRRLIGSELAETEFTAKDVATTLGLSQRSAQRFLRWAAEAGKVEFLSRGPKSAYRIVVG